MWCFFVALGLLKVHVVALLEHFWPLLAALGSLWGRFWAPLGRSWALLGRSWLFLAALGPSWAALGRSWAALGQGLAALGPLLAVLGTSWAAHCEHAHALGTAPAQPHSKFFIAARPSLKPAKGLCSIYFFKEGIRSAQKSTKSSSRDHSNSLSTRSTKFGRFL